jgi:hypothetical protein
MRTQKITAVVLADATPDPVTPPTTSFLARTTSYPDVLAHYVDVITRLSISADRPSGPTPRTGPARRLSTPGRQRPLCRPEATTVASARPASR